jgi:hypothetical protein
MLSEFAPRVIFIFPPAAPPNHAAILTLMCSARPIIVLFVIVLFQAISAYLLVEYFDTHEFHLLKPLSQTHHFCNGHLKVGLCLSVFLFDFPQIIFLCSIGVRELDILLS